MLEISCDSSFIKGKKGFLFDVDGTLIDSNQAHAKAWFDVFQENGIKNVSVEQIREKIGMGGDHLMPDLTGIDADSATGKKISARRAEIFKAQYLPELKAFAGARDLLLFLKKQGYVLTIATSASKDDLAALLKQTVLVSLVHHTVTSSDAEESKPEPDIVASALKKAHLSATEVLMVGDTPYDAEAALRAGVGTIGFKCGGWDLAQVPGVVAVFDGPWELMDCLSK